jgi:hypothetical protein
MGALGSLSKSSTVAALNWSEWLLLGFGLLLVIGLIGERKTDEKQTDRQKRWYKRYELMVIIGVAGELIADGGVFAFSGHLQTIGDIQIARINRQTSLFSREAADANEHAAKADAHAGEANKRAAELELEAAKLRADNIKLEKKMFGLIYQHGAL